MSGFLQRPMFLRSASGLEVALLIVMTVGSARAQTPTGTIAGSLSDQSGAAVAGAAISVTNPGTGQARSALTSAEGRYAVEALLPASYQVVVEVSGFKRLLRLVNVEAGTTTTVDLKLEVGEMSEVTTATGATPLLHHDHHRVGVWSDGPRSKACRSTAGTSWSWPSWSRA
jgi:Carboxypeptidase regulatory-like domain